MKNIFNDFFQGLEVVGGCMSQIFSAAIDQTVKNEDFRI